jgi:hypothetical protein
LDSEWHLHEFLTAEGPEVRSVPPGMDAGSTRTALDCAMTRMKDLLRRLEESKR